MYTGSGSNLKSRNIATRYDRIKHDAVNLNGPTADRTGAEMGYRILIYDRLPAVARAVHQSVQPPIEQAVFSLHGTDPHGTGRVVNPAASVRAAKPAKVFVRFCRTPFAAPFGAGNSEHRHQISLPAFAERVKK